MSVIAKTEKPFHHCTARLHMTFVCYCVWPRKCSVDTTVVLLPRLNLWAGPVGHCSLATSCSRPFPAR